MNAIKLLKRSENYSIFVQHVLGHRNCCQKIQRNVEIRIENEFTGIH